jgi:hypothetical protein
VKRAESVGSESKQPNVLSTWLMQTGTVQNTLGGVGVKVGVENFVDQV